MFLAVLKFFIFRNRNILFLNFFFWEVGKIWQNVNFWEFFFCGRNIFFSSQTSKTSFKLFFIETKKKIYFPKNYFSVSYIQLFFFWKIPKKWRFSSKIAKNRRILSKKIGAKCKKTWFSQKKQCKHVIYHLNY